MQRSRQGGAAIGAPLLGLGVLALLSQGLAPLLLGDLMLRHRIDAAGLGLAASIEVLALTLTSTVAVFVVGDHLVRRVGMAALVVLALSNAAIVVAPSEGVILLLRILAGAAEGVVFWIVLAGVAGARLPERAASVLMAVVTAATLMASALFSLAVVPRFGSSGGFILLALVSLAGLGWCGSVAPNVTMREARSPRPKMSALGLLALVAALLFNAAGICFLVYIVPLATRAGLSAETGGVALTAMICGQLIGAVIAWLIAGQVSYLSVLAVSAAAYVLIWPSLVAPPGAAVFITLAAAHGLVTFAALPFLYSLCLRADPGRQAAVLIGPAQMLGSALGPLAAVAAVAHFGLSSIAPLGLALLAVAMLVVVFTHVTSARTLDSDKLASDMTKP